MGSLLVKQYILQVILIATLVLLLQACNENNDDDSDFDGTDGLGSSNDNLTDGLDSGGDNLPTSGDLNPKLSGRIFVENSAGTFGKILNLDTGKYGNIPGMEAWAMNDEYTGVAFVTIFPSYDGLELVETVQNCKKTSEGSLFNDDCVIIRNKEGVAQIRLSVLEEIKDAAKLSYDGQYLAFSYNEYDDDNMSLRIHDRAGKLVSVNRLYEQFPDSYDDPEFDWLPNGRLVYAVEQTIYLTTPYDTDGKFLITFTKEQGEPVDLAVSPDGKNLAFTMRADDLSWVRTTGTVWVMSIDNPSDVHELAIVPRDDTPSVINPVWSPDGRWIMVVEGKFNATGIVPEDHLVDHEPIPSASIKDHLASHELIDTAPTLYAVPSDGIRVELSETEATTAIPVLSNWSAMLFGGTGEIKSRSEAKLIKWVP